MERDHDAAAARREQIRECVEEALELVELGVDRDADALERARRRVNLGLTLLDDRDGLCDQAGQLRGRAQSVFALAQRLFYHARDALRVALFAEVADQGREVGLVRFDQEVARGWTRG